MNLTLTIFMKKWIQLIFFFERDDIKLDKLLGSGYIGEVYQGRITLFE